MMKIENPLVIMFKSPDGEVVCHLHTEGYTHEHYGLLICDLVRHAAAAFKVSENQVWNWVDKERYGPTTAIKRPS